MNSSKLLMLFLAVLFVSSCELIPQKPINVVGVWSWEAAFDKEKNDLMISHDYHTIEFRSNLTYEYSIDTLVVKGVYEVDEGNNILRLDYHNVWELLKANDHELWIRNLTNEGHEWHLKK